LTVKRLLRSGALAGAAVALSVTYAPAQTANWSGFYIGGHAGYAWSHIGKSMTPDPAYPVLPSFLAMMTSDFASPFSINKFIGGGQIGFNWQSGTSVLGLEADVTSLGLHKQRQFTYPAMSPLPPNYIDQDVKVDWMFTVRPRLGIAVERGLFYVTGGVAIAEVTATDTIFHPGSGSITITGTSSKTKAGPTIGGGFEYLFTNNWSVRGEYLYADLGHATSRAPSTKPIPFPTVNASFDTHVTVHLARFGLNYKF
jgi:outer membrane immunogenic protein